MLFVADSVLSKKEGKEYEEKEEDKAQAKQENLDEFQNKAADYYANHDEAALTDFLEEVALVADIDNMDSEAY